MHRSTVLINHLRTCATKRTITDLGQFSIMNGHDFVQLNGGKSLTVRTNNVDLCERY
jgi:hypothetical protein